MLVSIAPLSSVSVAMVLGEYLNHIAYIKDKLPSQLREEARIGADVIAASSQYTIAAVDSLSDEETPSNALPVFALSRSAVYGLIYLDNVDLVRQGERLPRALDSTQRICPHNSCNKEGGGCKIQSSKIRL